MWGWTGFYWKISTPVTCRKGPLSVLENFPCLLVYFIPKRSKQLKYIPLVSVDNLQMELGNRELGNNRSELSRSTQEGRNIVLSWVVDVSWEKASFLLLMSPSKRKGPQEYKLPIPHLHASLCTRDNAGRPKVTGEWGQKLDMLKPVSPSPSWSACVQR